MWKRPNPEIRYKSLLDMIPDIKSNYILDAGAGDGLFTEILRKLFPKLMILTTDKSKSSKLNNLGFIAMIEKLPIRRKSISFIFCSQILHYLTKEKQKQTIIKLQNVLDNEGIFVIIEYELNKSYAWIPYPIDAKDLLRFINDDLNYEIIDKNRIQDGSRPKYSVIFKKIR